jgi:single-stranded DNA-binding protein
MSKWNDVSFEGTIGKEPVARVTQTGKTITSFSLAVYQGKEKPTMWLTIKTMETVDFKKGAKVAVKGNLFFEEWKASDDSTRQTWGVWASSVGSQQQDDTGF